MRLSVECVANQINSNNILVLVDGNKLIPNLKLKQKYIIKVMQLQHQLLQQAFLQKWNVTDMWKI